MKVNTRALAASHNHRAPVSSLRLGSRIVPWTPSSLGKRLATDLLRTNNFSMVHRTFFRLVASTALAFFSMALQAQVPTEPTAYSVTVRYEISGTALRTTYRLGSRVLVDQIPAPGIPPSATPTSPTRTLYFLDTSQSLSWEPANPAAACTSGSFQGDAWLDPFSGAADLALPDVRQLGSETIHGIAAKILVSKAKPGFKLWVDPKTGLMLKAEFTPPSSDKAIPYFEVVEVDLEPPPARLFEVPSRCGPQPQASKSTGASN